MTRWLPFVKSVPSVAVVRLQGTIAATGRNALNDQSVAPMLHRAFSKGKPKAVALVINSPGGSPAQSSLIGARIRRLAEEKEIPVYAFVEDVAASGGYWIAAAADEIWVDATSIVGSIGVISASFGFHELMARQGVERRVHTAGKDKSMLDPFRPERPEDVERLKALQLQLHDTFKGHITARRGTKLPQDRDLFTGEVWIGQQGIDVGLADGIGHVVPVMKEKFGEKTRFRTYGPRRALFNRFGLQLVDDAIEGLEARGLWARYGL